MSSTETGSAGATAIPEAGSWLLQEVKTRLPGR